MIQSSIPLREDTAEFSVEDPELGRLQVGSPGTRLLSAMGASWALGVPRQ